MVFGHFFGFEKGAVARILGPKQKKAARSAEKKGMGPALPSEGPPARACAETGY